MSKAKDLVQQRWTRLGHGREGLVVKMNSDISVPDIDDELVPGPPRLSMTRPSGKIAQKRTASSVHLSKRRQLSGYCFGIFDGAVSVRDDDGAMEGPGYVKFDVPVGCLGVQDESIALR